MNYDTILEVENFIEKLQNPRKKSIVRELIVNPKYEIFMRDFLGKTELFVKEINNKELFTLSAYVHTLCNCGQ